MKKIGSTSILFFMVLTIQVFAQLESIKEFPRAYKSQEILDLTPVWISNNEILVFYKNSTMDTIFSRRTTNLGQTWSGQKFEKAIEYTWWYPDIYLYKTTNGRLLFFYVNQDSLYCSYSDNKGLNWIFAEEVSGTGVGIIQNISLIEINQNELILSYSNRNSWLTCLSTDRGESWSNPNYLNIPYFPTGKLNPHLIKLSSNGDSLLGIYSNRSGIIYYILSTDHGESWSDTTRIVDTKVNHDHYPFIDLNADAVYDSNNDIWLTFSSGYAMEEADTSQYDISVLRSTDNGNSWQQMEKFTSYLGDDYLAGATSDGKNVLVCFNSSRSETFNQGFYGILGQSEDTNTPPVFINSEVVGYNYDTEEINYRVKVLDDEGVLRVFADLYQVNQIIELFDDGMHNDSLANDSVFGNILPVVTDGRQGNEYAFDINQISLPFNNKGVIADVNIGKYLTFQLVMKDVSNNVSRKEVRADFPTKNGVGSCGKYDDNGFLFSSGFFLSGYSNGQMWSNAVASASLVEDYLPGKIGSDINDPLNSIYVVNKRDPAFSYTWQTWKDAVSLGAEFYDGDGDGIYNPVDKNWNGTWDLTEDMPMLIGDEIAWSIYNDGMPRNQRRWNTVEPQGIEVRQTIFATEDPELENVIFIRYSILNTGTVADLMDSVYFGIWEDGDLGDATDDVVGCDTLLNSGYYYADEPDYQYGENPPAFFSTLLQGPILNTNNLSDTAKVNFGNLLGTENISGSKNLDVTSHIFFIGGDPNLRNPDDAIEARNYLLGRNRIGELPNPCNSYFGQVRGGVDCHKVNPHFWLSGDPVTNVGWISDQNRDTRNLVSTGPFELEKDKPQEIIIAYIIGRGSDPINSVTVARENVQRAIQEYQSNFASITYTSPEPTNPVNSYLLHQNYPNPFNPTTTIRYELPQDGQVTIEIFDILGQKVKTILNEFKKADRYEVTFNSSGLASGVYIYQLRVNDFITSKKMLLVK